jgi:hypothetical protein
MSQVKPYHIKKVEESADYVLEEPSENDILDYVRTGDRISYIGMDKLYRSGGFVTKVAEDGSSLAITGGPYKWTLRQSFIKKIFVSNKK